MRLLTVLVFLISVLSARAAVPETPAKLTTLPDRVRVELGGELFTEYVFGDGASRPYCYPILAVDGTPLTRDFPMKETAGEDTDHPWHRSLWFAHSMVNGVDFWNEGTGDAGRSPKAKGRSEHAELLEAKSGEVGVLRTRNQWKAPDGRLICTDERTLRFRGTTAVRMLDYEVTWRALPNEPLLIGDNKDGTMAIRVAQWMTMPHKYKKADVPGEGHIVTSSGARDADAWGKRAAWCDYFAPRGDKTYGVAIFDHPKNLRHPTWWMARDYGLFGANPFGQHDYENLKDQPHIGDYTIPAGGSLTLRYRFVFHLGDEVAGKIADLYADYAAGK
jgi:hypothetical protein